MITDIEYPYYIDHSTSISEFGPVFCNFLNSLPPIMGENGIVHDDWVQMAHDTLLQEYNAVSAGRQFRFKYEADLTYFLLRWS